MALVVETGSGANPAANSYISEVDANAYLTNSGRNTGAWKDAGASTRAGYLVLAAQYMASRWNLKWRGVRAQEDQPLDFPRFDTYKRSGFAYDSTEIPVEMQHAQVEYAIAEANNPGALFGVPETDSSRRDIVEKTDKVDVLTETRKFSGSNTPPRTWLKYPIADGLIKHLVSGGAVSELARL